jgi:hypothetical protein
VWLNDKEDKFGNIMSVQINPTKEMKDLEDRIYIGNLKESKGGPPVNSRDVAGLDSDLDIEPRPTKPAGASDVTEPIDDLPF